MRYVSLHTHSTYSYMDGFELPEAHVERVAELGMTAVALTEHGNVSSHVKLEQAAQKHGIKPIYGLEAYTAPADMRETANQRKWHQTILAMSATGYENLMRIVTESWLPDAFYRWPTVLGSSVAQHHEDLIFTSGCADSLLACSLLGGKGIEDPSYEAAVKVLKRFKRLLGDRYYLEVQRFPGLERSRTLNRQYAAWSEEFGVPLVASSDVHYPRPEQNQMQKILHAAGRGGTNASVEAEWEYDILLTYPLSDKEIRDDLIATGLTKKQAEQSIENSAEIAERCTVELPKMDRLRYPITEEDMKPWPAPIR